MISHSITHFKVFEDWNEEDGSEAKRVWEIKFPVLKKKKQKKKKKKKKDKGDSSDSENSSNSDEEEEEEMDEEQRYVRGTCNKKKKIYKVAQLCADSHFLRSKTEKNCLAFSFRSETLGNIRKHQETFLYGIILCVPNE